MAHVFSYLRHSKKPLSGALLLSFIYAIYKVKQTHFGSKKTKEQHSKTIKVGVNKTFFEQMKKLMPICIPGT
jgi:ATP-binding cassette subfamily D (ALD) protein 3